MDGCHPSLTWMVTILLLPQMGIILFWLPSVSSFFKMCGYHPYFVMRQTWKWYDTDLSKDTPLFKDYALKSLPTKSWMGSCPPVILFGMAKAGFSMKHETALCKAPWVLNLHQFNVRSILHIHPFLDELSMDSIVKSYLLLRISES